MQGAKIAGASRIIAVDRLAAEARSRQVARRDRRRRRVLCGRRSKGSASSTGGRGADYTFEVVGISQTIEQAFAMTRRGGTCVLVGAGSPTDEVTLQRDGALLGHEDVHRLRLRVD